MHARPFTGVFNDNVAKVFQHYVTQYKGLQFCTAAHTHHFRDDILFDGREYYQYFSLSPVRSRLLTEQIQLSTRIKPIHCASSSRLTQLSPSKPEILYLRLLKQTPYCPLHRKKLNIPVTINGFTVSAEIGNESFLPTLRYSLPATWDYFLLVRDGITENIINGRLIYCLDLSRSILQKRLK